MLAFVPALSVSERAVIATIGFALALILGRSLAGSPAGLYRSIACFAAALSLTAFVLEGDRGVASFLGGACCGGLVHVPRMRAGQQSRPGRSAWGLVGACIIVGPLLGLLVLGIADLRGLVMPVDRAQYVVLFLYVGWLAGLLAAMVVGVIVVLSPGRSRARPGPEATADADQPPG